MEGILSQTTRLLLSLVLAALFLGCAGSGGAPEGRSQSELQFEGTVQYRDLEGGAWVIVSEEGTTYEPRGLPEAYRKEGLPVRVWADRLEGQASIRIVGPIISIRRIERRR